MLPFSTEFPIKPISGKAAFVAQVVGWLIGPSRWALSPQEIDDLAYDLGGVAHVIVEPDREFSFELRDRTDAANAYGGRVGLILPGRGLIRRFHIGWRLEDSSGLVSAVQGAAFRLRLQMPAVGWEWTELQEQALRAHRERDRNRLTGAEVEKLYQEEISALQERVRQYEEAAAILPAAQDEEDEPDSAVDDLVRRLGPEVYPGELSDRLRLAARLALSQADSIGLDPRSRAIFDKLATRLPSSPGLLDLLDDLRRASKDPKRIASELVSLLKRHGYHEKGDNKHIRLEANSGYEGLEALTLPKTPSENRGLKNLRKQIERTLGLTRLIED